MKTFIFRITTFIVMIALLISCRDFLDEKSNVKLATPETIEDNQALLDQFPYVNNDFAVSGQLSSDDFYLNSTDYNALQYEEYKRLYTWQPDNVSTSITVGNDWMHCYRSIYIANAVLKNIEIYKLSGREADNVRGQALAIRASRYLDAAQIWCIAYNPSTADKDLGMPLRLDPDMNLPTVRSSLKETYNQILADLNEALGLLPDKQITPVRFSKTAVLGYLARTYLLMGEYEKSSKFAEETLNLHGVLMNFNNLNSSATYPIKDMNEEVILRTSMKYEPFLINAKIPEQIFNLYDENDLRKKFFFTKNNAGEIVFKGNYNNMGSNFTGLASDEFYLIAAECYARTGNFDKGMTMLNKLLITRWKSGTFIGLKATNTNQAIDLILQERKKELLLRGLRWADLKRYNRDGANIELTRVVGTESYWLKPNDWRYAIAIPEDIIKLTGIKQNIR